MGNDSDLEEFLVFLQPQLVCSYFVQRCIVSCTNWSWRNKGIIIPAVRVWIWRQRNTECHPSLTASAIRYPRRFAARQSPGPHSHYRWGVDQTDPCPQSPFPAAQSKWRPSLRRDPAPSSHRAPPLRGRNTDDPRGIDTLTRLSWHTEVVLPGCIKRAVAPAARQARRRPNPLLLSVHWPPGTREVPFIGTSIQSVNGG